MAFGNFQRFLCSIKDNFDANANSEFQALLSNEFKAAQLKLDEAKRRAITKSGYVTLPIESITESKIKFYLTEVSVLGNHRESRSQN